MFLKDLLRGRDSDALGLATRCDSDNLDLLLRYDSDSDLAFASRA